MKQSKRFLSFVIAVCMILGIVPAAATATETPEQFGVSIGAGVSAIVDRHNIVFGGNSAQWLVLDSDCTTTGQAGVALLSKDIVAKDIAYNEGGMDNAWANSDAKVWLSEYAAEVFDETALGYIMDTTKAASSGTYFEESWGEDALSAEKLFFLSAAEVDEYFYHGSIEGLIAIFDGQADGWWLRSAYSGRDIYAGVVSDAGFVGYPHISATWGARPAFNISADVIALSSAAVGGKVSGTVGADALTAVDQTSADQWKLTLIDDAHSAFTASFADADASGVINQTAGYENWVLPIEYSGAVSGENEYVSVMICDQSGDAIYYGHIANNSVSGTVNVNMPSGLSGLYSIYVFAEQCNGDNATDYGSALVTADIVVDDSISGVESWGLKLEGDIQADFNLTLADEVLADDDAYVQVTVDDEIIQHKVSDLEIVTLENGTEAYLVSTNVAAAQMTDDICIQVITSSCEGSKYLYSVRKYGDYILSSDAYSDSVKNLVKAMLVYGGKAQDYFNYNVTDLADNGITVAKTEIPYTENLTAVKQGSSAHVKFYGASLIHEHQTGIRFYFVSTDAAISAVSFSMTIADQTISDVQVKKSSNSLYFVELSDIAPNKLCDEITVSVDGLSVTYSPFYYIHRMYYNNGNKRVLRDMMQAMYDYYLYAVAYLGA